MVSAHLLFALVSTFLTLGASAASIESRAPAALPYGWQVASACALDDGDNRVFGKSSTSLSLQRNVLHLNTPTICVALCAKNGYGYAALRLGTECWCSSNAPKLFNRPRSECTRACSGSPWQTCGGGKSSAVYVNPRLAGNRPRGTTAQPRLAGHWDVAHSCVDDPTLGESLLAGTKVFELQNNSPLACTTLCAAKGYKLAGVEYSNECMCGQGWRRGAKPAPRPAQECNMACTGDSRLTCGAGHRVQLYKHASFKRDTNSTAEDVAEVEATDD
ncbi:hypothetical protein AURDEDRAFT_183752 [Auricularia subglabra TFB-10046 SS5]|nr:hypothetical protein AURDEDRAFT_183752 [Auricularia subglabra TFB-10046 SS5]